MDILFAAATVITIIVILIYINQPTRNDRTGEDAGPNYRYESKEFLMTPSENEFFKTLVEIADGKYHVFPQIHLSALFKNMTGGRYHKVAFQRLNRISVDYVLCDINTLRPVYAIELDDPTHNKPIRQKRDAGVEQIFKDAHLPLVRFSNYRNMTKEDIIRKFSEAHNQQSTVS